MSIKLFDILKNREEMTHEKIHDVIHTLITEDMGNDKFDDASVLYGEICVDSMDMVEFSMDLENTFGIMITSEDEEMLHDPSFTVGRLCELVEGKIMLNKEINS